MSEHGSTKMPMRDYSMGIGEVICICCTVSPEFLLLKPLLEEDFRLTADLHPEALNWTRGF
jgi:hypothetical protein